MLSRGNRIFLEAWKAYEANRSVIEKGYSVKSTPEIVPAANVTRGARYHHAAGADSLLYRNELKRMLAEACTSG